MSSRLIGLLRDCWGNTRFPERCFVQLAYAEEQDDLGDVTDLVTAMGGRDDLITRLRAEHPTDRPHNEQFDLRLLDAMGEALAFAWLTLQEFGNPQFCLREGYPDLCVPNKIWVEAKTIHLSDAERQEIRDGVERGGGIYSRVGWRRRDFPRPLRRKFEDAWANALRKFERVDPDGHQAALVWFRIGGFDWPLSPYATLHHLKEWAEQIRPRKTGLVLVKYWNWAQPEFYREPLTS
ncbi:MAG: hypothetical protein M0R74_09360 [Dehalococcoidia bacterium]|nr:hypothetical protein [Dehalococcoidia bacterium]